MPRSDTPSPNGPPNDSSGDPADVPLHDLSGVLTRASTTPGNATGTPTGGDS